MSLRKHTVDNVEYNIFTDEELEEYLLVNKIELGREKEDYTSIDEFYAERKKVYDVQNFNQQ